MLTRLSRRFLLIGHSFAEKHVRLAENFELFFKDMLLTLFYLERHVVESKNYFWELISIVMLTRLSRRFLLIGPSFAEKRVRLAENFEFFFKNMLLTLFYLERHVVESKNSFLRINLHSNAHKVIETIFADWTLFCWETCKISRELRIFLQKYVAYTILSRKTCGGEQKFFLIINLHSNAHKVIETIFADWTLFCWKTCKISRELRIFLQKYVAYIILSRKTCGGEQKFFLIINLHSNAHKVIETIFADWTLFCWKTCKISRELRIFLQRYVAYIILSRKTCGGEQKFFLSINLHSNAHKVIETIFADWTLFCWKTCKISRELRIFLQKYAAHTILSRKTCGGEQKLFLRINLHSNAHKVIETIFADWTLFCYKTCKISRELRIFLRLHYFISKDMWWRAKIIFEN